ncbi:MAG: ATP-binding cassette domain-containing protein [Rhodopseudomonas palustris]|uniref:ATP-binding cassette domain-containing protein n=1 Tax=Rhodopseudomonas palustris TaxID=1076 RepID=A0A933S2W9_RHOPL|nr:ATP-binding cassette domain-containing protein [Rhodopseudomonas palustris]
MTARLFSLTIGELAQRHPAVAEFLAGARALEAKPDIALGDWIDTLDDDQLGHLGMDRDGVASHLDALVGRLDGVRRAAELPLQSLTLQGGVDKAGRLERLDLTLVPGDVACIVGPTGSGKSRLLADIECLAQGDTPSQRRVLVNGRVLDRAERAAFGGRLIAQLSQNMNFVVDLSVGEFVAMHANCRMVSRPDQAVAEVIACANELAGETFGDDVPLTQLSGGQTRALMIADTAVLSSSPVVLIDEIENAGIDRRRALDLLIAREKITLISTHDPILALMGDRRIVIGGGAVVDVIAPSAAEKANLQALGRIDDELAQLRHRLRRGERIDVLPDALFSQ